MDNNIKKWLFDILQAISEIDGFFENNLKIYEDYISDIKTRRAVERNIQIIGEAVSRILKEKSDFEIENARQIIGTRNRIIHGYGMVSNDMVWSIVINHLPKLKAEVENLIDKL